MLDKTALHNFFQPFPEEPFYGITHMLFLEWDQKSEEIVTAFDEENLAKGALFILDEVILAGFQTDSLTVSPWLEKDFTTGQGAEKCFTVWANATGHDAVLAYNSVETATTFGATNGETVTVLYKIPEGSNVHSAMLAFEDFVDLPEGMRHSHDEEPLIDAPTAFLLELMGIPVPQTPDELINTLRLLLEEEDGPDSKEG